MWFSGNLSQLCAECARLSTPEIPMSTFRKVYRQLTPEQLEYIEQIKDAAQRLEILIEKSRGTSHDNDQLRHIALAMTNLEQAVMWATKAYT
jgi:hypothetical protein